MITGCKSNDVHENSRRNRAHDAFSLFCQMDCRKSVEEASQFWERGRVLGFAVSPMKKTKQNKEPAELIKCDLARGTFSLYLFSLHLLLDFLHFLLFCAQIPPPKARECSDSAGQHRVVPVLICGNTRRRGRSRWRVCWCHRFRWRGLTFHLHPLFIAKGSFSL